MTLNGSSWDPDAEAPFDPDWDLEDGEFTRRPHRRFVRVVGIVTAASLALATIGTTIGVFWGGGSSPSGFPTAVVSVGPPTASALGASAGSIEREYTEQVDFHVANDSPRATRLQCRVSVLQRSSVLGSRTEETSVTVPSGDSAELYALVSIAVKAFQGTPSDARVRCAAVS